MASQHFYSRVPAKVSMFNRADGFDTFACSEGVTKPFIERDLSPIYNYKLSKEEPDMIREGKLSPVYFQQPTKDGKLIQSCFTYLPLDYTKERTSFLVHSLITEQDEKKNIVSKPGSCLLNPALFVKDLEGFDLISFDSAPDRKYPTLDYAFAPAKDPSEIVEEFDKELIRRIIYMLLAVTCGGAKALFFSLGSEITPASQENLDFFNSIVQIFPYSLRSRMSFVSFVSDSAKYSSFKIKGVVDSFPELAYAKGAVIHLGSRVCFGLRDEVVRDEAFLVDFFYELIGDLKKRKAFLEFMQGAEARKPELADFSMKILRELVLLFCHCSRLYDEEKILPTDDAVLGFVNAYDKHREALPESYRAVAMRFLARYPIAHIPIPTKIFTKIIKQYPDEPASSQKMIMGILSALFHTDAMRDKLFAFFRSRYKDEPSEIRETIANDVCQVYYGGFLRAQILEFFTEIFESASPEARDTILERVILTIHADSIRPGILAFIRRYYPIFTQAQKKKFFTTFFDIMTEGSEISKELLIAVNDITKNEPETFRKSFVKTICNLIVAEQNSEKHPMLRMIESIEHCPVKDTFTRIVFGTWYTKPIFDEYVSFTMERPLDEAVSECIENLRHQTAVPQEAVKKYVLLAIKKLSAKMAQTDLLTAIRMDTDATKTASSSSDAELKAFCTIISEKLIRPRIYETLNDIFKIKDGIIVLRDYTAVNPGVKNCPAFENVKSWKHMEVALGNGNYGEFFAVAGQAQIRLFVSGMLECLKTTDAAKSVLASSAIAIASKFCRNELPDLDGIFSRILDDVRANKPEEQQSKDGFDEELKSMKALLSLLNCLLERNVFDTEGLLFTTGCPLEMLITAFVERFKRKAVKGIIQVSADIRGFNPKLRSKVEQTAKNSGGGIFSRLFGK